MIAGFLSEEVFSQFEKSNPELIEQISQHNIIIINGEGTLHARPSNTEVNHICDFIRLHKKYKNDKVL